MKGVESGQNIEKFEIFFFPLDKFPETQSMHYQSHKLKFLKMAEFYPMQESMLEPMIGPSSECWYQLMMTIDIGSMINRSLDDNCEPILTSLAPKSSLIIVQELLPELSRRPFKFIMILILIVK